VPSSSSYYALASQLDGIGGELPQLVAPVRAQWGSGVMKGGRLATDVERTIDACEANVHSAASMVRTMASECRRRAAICGAYEAEYSAWMQRNYEAWNAYFSALQTYQDAVSAGSTTAVPPATPNLPPPIKPPYPWVD
jgi:uncharacterized protein YukE